ncbi:MAG: 30S ribosomal protein S6 [Chloroflexi bacterium]|nr:30S ribosomal protein S6 [Chloroflexota bacterium]
MRDYELTIIFQPKLEETARNEIIGRIVGWLTNNDENAPAPVVNHWGKRFMAYPIKKKTQKAIMCSLRPRSIRVK